MLSYRHLDPQKITVMSPAAVTTTARPSPSNRRDGIQSQSKTTSVAKIVLNSPRVNLGYKGPVHIKSTTITDDNTCTSIGKVGEVVEFPSSSGQSSASVSNSSNCYRQRHIPSRDCKSRPLSSQNNNNNATTTSLPKTKKRKLKKRTQKNDLKTRVTRGAMTKFKIAAEEAKSSRPRENCYRIKRTVELVNQTTEDWRELKSKLLFILSLGLTPKPDSDTVINPVVRILPPDPAEVEKIQKRYGEMKAAKKAERQARVHQRLEQMRARAIQNNRVSSSSGPIEVIDLASDVEDEQDEFILPDLELPYYPNLTILKSSQSSESSSSQQRPVPPLIHMSNTNNGSDSLKPDRMRMVPKLIKRVDYKSPPPTTNRIQGIKENSLYQTPTHGSHHHHHHRHITVIPETVPHNSNIIQRPVLKSKYRLSQNGPSHISLLKLGDPLSGSEVILVE